MSAETAIYLRVRGVMVRVNGRTAVVGRSRSCDVQIDEPGISRRHCEIVLRDDGVSIRDLGSSHGTYVDGGRLAAEAHLPAGATVTLGARGPSFELINAIVQGTPVLGGRPTDASRPAASAAVPTVSRGAPAAASVPPPPSPAAPPPPPENRFVAGLLWGTFAGLLLGAAAIVVLDLREVWR